MNKPTDTDKEAVLRYCENCNNAFRMDDESRVGMSCRDSFMFCTTWCLNDYHHENNLSDKEC